MNIKEILIKYPPLLEEISSTPRLDVEVLLCNLIKKDRLFLLLNLEFEISDDEKSIFDQYFNQRLNHRPIQYIVNRQEFMGLDFFVEEGVLIPRSDTEILVEEAIEYLKKIKNSKIVDIGTGSGAISVSLAKYISDSKVYSLDISKKAIEIGSKNAKKHEVDDRIQFIESDLFQNLNIDEELDLIISNPPYIKKEEINNLEKQVKDYEPSLALDGGVDGLDFYKRIISESDGYLKKGGLLAFETGHDQARDIAKILEETKIYKEIKIIKDLSGIERVVTGVKV